MFMEPIEVPTATVAKRPPSASGMVFGALFVTFAAMVMLPWFLLLGTWIATKLLIEAGRGAATLIVDTLRYAGQVTIGR